MRLDEAVEKIETREDLAGLIDVLRQDLITSPDDWENRDPPSYLEARSAWVRDFDGYAANTGGSESGVPSWRLLAEILVAARVYE